MKILHPVCRAICSIPPMMASSKSASSNELQSSETRYSLSGKCVGLPMLVGIAELELLFGQFKIQIQHIVRSGDTVGYLHGKDGLAYIGIRKEAGQFPLIPETVPQRTGRGQQRCFKYRPVGGLDTHSPMLSGIPCCTWVALVRSPCIRLI